MSIIRIFPWPRGRGLALAMTVASACVATSAAAADVDDEIAALKARLAALEQAASNATPSSGPPPADTSRAGTVTGGATAGSFRLPGSDTSIAFGGYVKLDAIYSDRSVGVANQGNQLLLPSLIPVGPTAADHDRSQTTIHARQSRVFVKTATPTPLGDLSTYVEGDFFGADGNETFSNSNGFRIRHAFATLGPLSAGQSWSNFMNEAALPETLDFGGPVGQLFVRQAQLRWTGSTALGKTSFSIENPESLFAVPGTATLLRADRDRWPDITARLQRTIGGGSYAAQLIARNVRFDAATPIATNDSRWGGAMAVTGIVPTRIGSDDVRFELEAGNAIGRYAGLGFLADGYVGDDHRVRLAPTIGGYVAYRHLWTPQLRSSLVLSALGANEPAGTFGGIDRSTRSEHLNLIWTPVRDVNLGVELINARRATEDDRSGSLSRVQLSAQYGF